MQFRKQFNINKVFFRRGKILKDVKCRGKWRDLNETLMQYAYQDDVDRGTLICNKTGFAQRGQVEKNAEIWGFKSFAFFLYVEKFCFDEIIFLSVFIKNNFPLLLFVQRKFCCSFVFDAGLRMSCYSIFQVTWICHEYDSYFYITQSCWPKPFSAGTSCFFTVPPRGI